MKGMYHLDFFGLKLSSFTDDELVNSIDVAIINDKKMICYGYNFGMFP
jgi:hypothetical protein